MSTLVEIEQAIERLPENEVSALRAWLSAREARPALAKWREQGTGLVKQMGGVDAYLRQVRGETAGE
jgi:hypothetical protein